MIVTLDLDDEEAEALAYIIRTTQPPYSMEKVWFSVLDKLSPQLPETGE